MKRREASRLKK